MEEIWDAAGLDQEEEKIRWSVLGLDVQKGEGGSRSSRVVWKTGRLGLDCLVSRLGDVASVKRLLGRD